MVSTNASDQAVLISADESTKFSKYQVSLKPSSTYVTAIADSCISSTCLLSTSSKWIIDSGATDHMTSNSNLFSIFQSHSSTSTVTLVDGSPSFVLRSGTVAPTPLLHFYCYLSAGTLNLRKCAISNVHGMIPCTRVKLGQN